MERWSGGQPKQGTMSNEQRTARPPSHIAHRASRICVPPALLCSALLCFAGVRLASGVCFRCLLTSLFLWSVCHFLFLVSYCPASYVACCVLRDACCLRLRDVRAVPTSMSMSMSSDKKRTVASTTPRARTSSSTRTKTPTPTRRRRRRGRASTGGCARPSSPPLPPLPALPACVEFGRVRSGC